MGTVIWKGLEKFETADNELAYTAKGDNATVVYAGKHAVLKAAMPRSGYELAGYPDMVVDKVRLVRRPGGVGELTISLEYSPRETNPGDPRPLSDTIAVAMVQAQRALADAARFTGSGSGANVSEIEAWRRETDPALKAAYKYRVPVPGGSYEREITNELTRKICDKVMKGQTGYSFWAPQVTRTREFRRAPRQARAYELVPPVVWKAATLARHVGRKPIPLRWNEIGFGGAAAPFDLVYCLIGFQCRETPDGRWVVSEIWLGAKSHDADYYGEVVK